MQVARVERGAMSRMLLAVTIWHAQVCALWYMTVTVQYLYVLKLYRTIHEAIRWNSTRAKTTTTMIINYSQLPHAFFLYHALPLLSDIYETYSPRSTDFLPIAQGPVTPRPIICRQVGEDTSYYSVLFLLVRIRRRISDRMRGCHTDPDETQETKASARRRRE